MNLKRNQFNEQMKIKEDLRKACKSIYNDYQVKHIKTHTMCTYFVKRKEENEKRKAQATFCQIL